MSLILPNQPPSGPLTIFVPKGYGTTDGPRKTGECFLCGAEFFAGVGDSPRKHVERCARNLDRSVLRPIEERLPALADQDPEITEHLRKVGQRMLREGRMVTKPSERAGFS